MDVLLRHRPSLAFFLVHRQQVERRDDASVQDTACCLNAVWVCCPSAAKWHTAAGRSRTRLLSSTPKWPAGARRAVSVSMVTEGIAPRRTVPPFPSPADTRPPRGAAGIHQHWGESNLQSTSYQKLQCFLNDVIALRHCKNKRSPVLV